MKFVLTLFIVFLLSSCGIDDTIDGNDGDLSGWEKTWNSGKIDKLYSISLSFDNKVYVGGETWGELYSEKEGKYDAILAAFNPKGEELWGKQWSVVDDESDVRGIAVDSNGDVYVGGGGGILL